MAGIVKSTKKRIVVNKKIREIVTPTAVLDTDLFFADLTAIGGTNSTSLLTAELGRLPAIVKNETELTMVAGARTYGQARGMNGNTKTIDSLSFTRGSNGTFISVSGAIGTEIADMPRFEYNPLKASLKGFLFEPASTNLLLYSGMGNYGNFQLIYSADIPRCSVVTEVGRSCIKVAEGGTFRFSSVSVTGLSTYTYSFWIKSNTPFSMVFSNYSGSSSYNSEVYNITSNWQRITKTFVARNDATFDIPHMRQSAGSNTPEFFIADAQLEPGDQATSYIPTTNAIASRLADKLVGTRPIAVFNKNAWYIESEVYTGWFGSGVNGVKCIGRNYIRKSALFYFFSNNNSNSYNFQSGIENGVRWISGTHKELGKFYLSTYSVLVNGPEVTENLINAPDLISSLDVMVTANITLRFGSKSYNMTAGVWQRITESGLTVDRIPSLYVTANLEVPPDTRVYYKNYKLERGTEATPWSPAPEDFIKVDASGNLEISSDIPVAVRSLSLVARQLKQEEV